MNYKHDTVPRFLPPYISTEEHVDEAGSILEKVFTQV